MRHLEDYRERLLNYILEMQDFEHYIIHLQWYIGCKAQLNKKEYLNGRSYKPTQKEAGFYLKKNLNHVESVICLI